ncbi:MAG: outer membrane beta-barrel protein [Desulfobacterales bacterium]|nr:outer membrane beta-barrel protein [Desulfobacterales bacterium]
MKYRNSNLEYDNSVQEGGEEHRGIFELGYELTAVTRIALEYQLAKMDYDQNTSDYLTNQVKLVVGYDLGLFSLEVGAGVNERDFDDTGVDDTETFVYHVKLSMEGAETKISLGSEYNFNDRGPGNGYYTAHKVGLDAEILYADRFPLGISGYFMEMEYVDTQGLSNTGASVDRKDNVYHVSGRVGYKITESITFTVQGGYEDMQSNTVGDDYDNTFVLGAIEIGLYPR